VIVISPPLATDSVANLDQDPSINRIGSAHGSREPDFAMDLGRCLPEQYFAIFNTGTGILFYVNQIIRTH
jgi:hypothetical protein